MIYQFQTQFISEHIMKPFKYEKIDKRLGKKSEKEVNEQKMRQNFLKLYDDIPPDPKMQKYCEQVKQVFDQRRKNSRYYSYELQKKEQNSLSILRTQQIKKLNNYEMPYKTQTSKEEEDPKRQELNKRRRRARQKELMKKFKQNIKLILYKMKKMRVTMQDIIVKNLFSKQPYKFGSDIFVAAKEGSVQKVWRILIENKYSLFSVDNTWKNVLFWACIRGNCKIAQIVIEAGIDLDKKDIYGCNALYYATKYNHGDCVKLLMLNLSNYDEMIMKQAKSCGQVTRDIFNLCVSLRKNFMELDIEKRSLLFEEQYNYFYKS